MRTLKIKSHVLATIITVTILLSCMLASVFVSAQAGAVTVTSANIVFTDGSNSMAADLNLGGNELENVTGLWYGSNNRTDMLAYPVTESSYTIFKVGSTYYAQNGTTKQIDYKSTTSNVVVQQAINVIENGTILIKDDITITGTIVVNKTGIILTGETEYTKISTLEDIAIIRVDKPAGDINLGVVIRNFILQGGGSSDTNSKGVHVNDTWGLTLENLIIGDVYNGIEITNGEMRYLRNIIIGPTSELSLGNCYNGIYQTHSSGDGILGFWDNIDVAICENNAVYLEQVNSLWATNWKLIECGGNGLTIDGAGFASNFQNIQIDEMHGTALYLNDVLDTTFEGCWFTAASSSSPGYPTYGVSSGAGDYALYLNASERVFFCNAEFKNGNQDVCLIENCWHIKFLAPYINSQTTDGMLIDSCNGITITDATLEATSSIPTKTGIKYQGTAPTGADVGTLLKGCYISTNYGTLANLTSDPYHKIFSSPSIIEQNSGFDDWKLITTLTASATTYVETGSITACDVFMCVIDITLGNSAETDFILRLNSDTGNNYDGSYIDNTTITTYTNYDIMRLASSNSTYPIIGTIYIHGTPGSGFSSVTGGCVGCYNMNRFINGVYDASADITAIRFLAGTGTISGFIRVYGMDYD
jgi:hypothetical protein